jgi:Phage integrase family
MGFETPKELTKGNHPSLPHGQMPEFIAALRSRKAIAAFALELLILTNVRTNAVLQAKWPGFDLEKALWNVPLVNLKDREHRKESFEVPLAPGAVEIVKEMQKARVSVYVFPGQRRAQPLSNMAFLTLLKRMNAAAKGERPDPDAKPRWHVLLQGGRSRLMDSAPLSRPGRKRSRRFLMPRSNTRWATRSAARSSVPTPERRCLICAGS